MQIEYIKCNHIGRLVLSNPPYNTLTHPVFADAGELKAFLNDSSLKACIVCGQGRHFCAGADGETLREHLKDPQSLGRELNRGKALLEIIASATIPVVALIKGSCLGAGLEIALACHFRFASNSAMFGFPEIEYGLLPGLGGPVFSNDFVPRAVLVDLILSGRMINAAEAVSLGLINEAVSARDIDAVVGRFIDSMTAKRRGEQIRSVMTSIHNARRYPREEALRRETELFCRMAQSRD